MPVTIRSYTSPTLVLLAYDWPAGGTRKDFLGFAIERTPGFGSESKSWLPNRISFDGPKPDQSDLPSDQAPIQKFYWWDARIDTKDRGSTFSYRVVPVVGSKDDLQLLNGEGSTLQVQVPNVEEQGITTHFNRAVVSSQSFQKQFPKLNAASQQKAARAWLANGMEQAVPEFLGRAAGKDIEGAIYHLTDEIWILPAMVNYGGAISLAYNQTSKDHTSDAAIEELVKSGRPMKNFVARTHANIMHDKFLVRVGAADHPEAVLTGSANFTSEGLSAQANVLHTFESPELGQLYVSRKRELDENPTLSETQKSQPGWSKPITVGDATISVYFPPATKDDDASLREIVDAVNAAQHSVLFCAYDPTYGPLLDAVKNAADNGKMVLGLVNRVPDTEPTGDPGRADVAAAIELWKWSEADHAVVGFGAFKAHETPTDFIPERVLWPGESPKIMVRIHHKFVVIDAESDHPVVFTGSANFSGNSLYKNDENLLKITDCPRLARIYMAEFMRLYEHYRARVQFARRQAGEDTFKLAADNSWAKKYFTPGSPETKARTAMAGTEAVDALEPAA
jgi:phosphatidylserine/phosphatidylglycerophosphate/cardiolipin synthase-like enzyme